jgi:NAD(P)-dependent dehydrogenase (short-subunit alcohol dehydrogenase family)
MIDAEGGVSEVVKVDVTDELSVQKAMQRTVELFGRLDILVNIGVASYPKENSIDLTASNTVGVGGAMGDATAVDMDAWDRDLRINLTSMVLTARHAIPHMRKNGRGAIVNMSSVSGHHSDDAGDGGSTWSREHQSQLRCSGNGVHTDGQE